MEELEEGGAREGGGGRMHLNPDDQKDTPDSSASEGVPYPYSVPNL